MEPEGDAIQLTTVHAGCRKRSQAQPRRHLELLRNGPLTPSPPGWRSVHGQVSHPVERADAAGCADGAGGAVSVVVTWGVSTGT
jgi:hypothetical protein